ncbi:unnamed protein product [Cuscuta campestris]|uniref:Uncharacterized protein n=1 Tax=Cuscuta campestris TaxID=132261 RepID=A0A484NNT7_9ASTE|nr:unnamed protein product [Cuscuta campestris]
MEVVQQVENSAGNAKEQIVKKENGEQYIVKEGKGNEEGNVLDEHILHEDAEDSATVRFEIFTYAVNFACIRLFIQVTFFSGKIKACLHWVAVIMET